ncbi:hypothetical protein ECA0157_24015 [Escherichia coli ECA-0157]|nr:hypothetical protein ECA0157_24015 [Escherichia coli ECA-0157]
MVLSCKAMRLRSSNYGADIGYSCSLTLRRWSSSRATVTSCPISSAALDADLFDLSQGIQ